MSPPHTLLQAKASILDNFVSATGQDEWRANVTLQLIDSTSGNEISAALAQDEPARKITLKFSTACGDKATAAARAKLLQSKLQAVEGALKSTNNGPT